jgi:hypothetical protein
MYEIMNETEFGGKSQSQVVEEEENDADEASVDM